MSFLSELGKKLGVTHPHVPAAVGGQGALVQTIMGLLAGGGLQQLVASFQQKGLGDIVGSWVSTGANLPISSDQIQRALGPDRMNQLSQQTGLDVGSLAGQLSSLLPGVVDKLTPHGSLPEGGVLQDKLAGLLKGIV